ncbi:FAD/NAD(P)-binding domain-containing protein, partial [Auricularia subglabra TFB-10046 SS5]
RIAIIGGGPAGLVLLNVLARNNVPATLYERDDESSARAKLGGSLDLHVETGQAALKAAGVWNSFENSSSVDRQEIRFANHQGKDLWQWAPPPDRTEFAFPEIDRADLCRILVDGAPEGSIKWGHGFVSATPVPGTEEWELTFANGEKAIVDLVVGADGGRSRVRPLLSDVKVQYTRVNGLEASWEAAKHPELAARVGGGTVWIPGPEHRLIYSQRSASGRVVTYAWFVCDDENEFIRDPETRVPRLLEYYKDWAPWVKDLVGVADRVVPRPLYMLPVGHEWAHRAGVTLIGDAMDLMTPFAGKGANIAMLAGLRLGRALVAARGASKEEFDAKVAEYEKEMFPLAK